MKKSSGTSHLIYTTDPVEAVKQARAKGWSDEKIITKLMFGKIYTDRLAIAKRYAPIMGIELSDFMLKAGLKKPPS